MRNLIGHSLTLLLLIVTFLVSSGPLIDVADHQSAFCVFFVFLKFENP